MRSKFAAIIVAAVLLIPTAIAAVNYFGTKSAPISDSVIESISISDLDGKTYTLRKDDMSAEAKEMFAAILNANERADKVPSLPEPLQGTKFFAVSMYGLEQTLNCQYYFKADTTVAYYLDNAAEAYQLPEDFVSHFQNSTYALSLYETAIPPQMTLCGSNSIAPDSVSWNYRLADGSFAVSPASAGNDVKNYFVDGGLDITFSNLPDSFDIKVESDGKEIYSGDYASMGDVLKFKTKTAVDVTVDAEWYQDNSRDYYGKASYSFTADIAAPPAFAVSLKELDPGDFTVVSVSNVSDVSRITFSCEPSIGYTPTFYLDGDYARALIPFSCELSAGDYKMKVGYGAACSDLSVTVKKKTFKTSYSDIRADVEKVARTEATIAAFNEKLSPIAKAGDGNISFEGKFFDYTVDSKGFSIAAGIGVNKVIAATRTSYQHNGVDFKVSAGTDVAAVNSGKVVFVGETALSGKLVVIEHGLGLKSWYAHLGDISIKEGDTVKKGDIIAKVGTTGFTNGNTLHLGLSVFDVPVSIYPLWENDGIVIVDPT